MSEIVISIGHLGHLVRAVIGDGAELGASVSYTSEPEPLGTAGSLRLIRNLNSEDLILCVNGDTLTDFDFRIAERAIVEAESDALIVVKERTTSIDFGVVEFDSQGFMLGYSEKPVLTHRVSTGINVLRGEAIERWLGEGRVEMPDLMMAIRAGGGKVLCLETLSTWLDLGRPEDLAMANSHLDVGSE